MNISDLFRRKSIAQIQKDVTDGTGDHAQSLEKNLQFRDLLAMGIAAVVGAGIFGTIGEASYNGGPAVVFLFIFTAFACIFSAFCYAEFASTIPVSGSAYTYAYTTFGELVAWIIGWALVMEYAIGNIAIAISWSDYVTGFLRGVNIHLPANLTMDYLTASEGYAEVQKILSEGKTIKDLSARQQEFYLAWTNATEVFGTKIIVDIPAFIIVVLITMLVYVGIKESKNVSNFLVILKLAVILLFIVVGIFYVNPANWSPFAPNGIKGVLSGVGAVFFAYIGFDAISTTAEECKNPQKDLPKAMMWVVILCTILYVAIALVLTGMVSYKMLAVGDPLAFVFEQVNVNNSKFLDIIGGIIAVSVIFAMTSVILVFQLGQPRIWMAMSRDGLLPKIFARIHPKYLTPSFSTIVTGVLVAVPSLFLNLKQVTELTSIGTLFAFAVVCGGVLLMNQNKNHTAGRFRVPYYNGAYFVPALLVIVTIIFYFAGENGKAANEPNMLVNFFAYNPTNEAKNLFQIIFTESKTKTFWDIRFLMFTTVLLIMLYLSIKKQLSAIPVVGLLVNVYLMSEIKQENWKWFLGAMAFGLVIYFLYGFKKSKLNTK